MVVDAREVARRYYSGSGRDPAADLFWHDKGLAVWTKEFVLMARPVCSCAPASRIVDVTVEFDDPDAWHVHLLCGDFSSLRAIRGSIAAFPVITYQRNGGRLRRMQSARLLDFICLP